MMLQEKLPGAEMLFSVRKFSEEAPMRDQEYCKGGYADVNQYNFAVFQAEYIVDKAGYAGR